MANVFKSTIPPPKWFMVLIANLHKNIICNEREKSINLNLLPHPNDMKDLFSDDERRVSIELDTKLFSVFG